MEELKDLLSFGWQGTKKDRYTTDKWSDSRNCRPLSWSKHSANALLTGKRQLDPTGRWKLIAVDLDNKDNWEEVIETFRALNLPQSLTVKTPSGGYHIFFWVQKDTPAQNINDDRHCKNFELKGDMSNITAPGSVFQDGSAYIVVRDIRIARLLPGEAYRLCKHKQEPRMPYVAADFIPDQADVEQYAHHLDERARKNTRGWQIRCPYHEDSRSSAVLFYSGWLYCSGCGHKEQLVKKGDYQVTEHEPDTENVAYMDEYPAITERLRVKRLAQARPLGHAAVFVLPLPINYREIMEQAPHE